MSENELLAVVGVGIAVPLWFIFWTLLSIRYAITDGLAELGSTIVEVEQRYRLRAKPQPPQSRKLKESGRP
jgi:hypothetical protein